ncbi:hypothetical protein KHP62_12550 [Rhodobacteraceae bacterium NNCM2]|nr:hypothetical protein [Coraliihabitans acroporae]
MEKERVRQLREVASILMNLFRTVAMYRALGECKDDHLNFFRLYNGCLMDLSVVAWCKVFGATNNETHWQRVLPENKHIDIRSKLWNVLGDQSRFEDYWNQITIYRNKNVAHHTFDEKERPQFNPYLMPLFDTGVIVYSSVYEELEAADKVSGLVRPSFYDSAEAERTVEHWKKIIAKARAATSEFTDSP